MNKTNSYFKRFACDICKAPADFYRYSSKTKKGYVLCSSDKCNSISDIAVGYRNLTMVGREI